MPNWCATQLKVYGELDELIRFRDGIRKQRDVLCILESYYPCPQALHDTDSTTFPVSADASDKAVAHAMKQMENLANYGHKDWYDWSNANWGTKWGDCDTFLLTPEPLPVTDKGASFIAERIHYLSFHLMSAWSPITTGMLKVSTLFPELIFVMSHDEEAGFYLCAEVIHDGEVLFEDGCSPCDDWAYDGETDTEEGLDRYIREFDEWKQKRMNEFIVEVDNYLCLMM